MEPVAETAELNVWERAAKPYPGLGICRNELTTGQVIRLSGSRVMWVSGVVVRFR